MARTNTNWLAKTAETMRRLGVVQATRRVQRTDGAVEEWALTLGPPEMVAFKLPPVEYSNEETPAPFDAALAKAASKRQRVYEVTGNWLTDEQLNMLPDNI